MGPVTNPTAPPTTTPVSPTTAPVTTPSGCVMFVISLNTDAYGYETAFTLINDYTLHLSRLMKLLVSTTDDISLPFLIHMVTECVVKVDKVAINLLLEAKL